MNDTAEANLTTSWAITLQITVAR